MFTVSLSASRKAQTIKLSILSVILVKTQLPIENRAVIPEFLTDFNLDFTFIIRTIFLKK